MSKKIVIAVFCCFALFICYRVEQNVYSGNTYAELKERLVNQRAEEKENMSDNTVKTLSEEAMVENLSTDPKSQEKIAYLTFDDGPSEITKTNLETLKDNGAVATFFLIGSQVTDETKPILKEMLKNGNAIGVHTYSHEGSTMYCSKEAYLEDFNKAYKVIKEITGVETKIWRFPWGSANSYIRSYGNEVISELEAKGFNYYDWNVTAEDSVGHPTAYSIMQNINKDYKKYNHPVILMHDSKCNELTARLLPQIIKQLKDAGYSFDTVDHMDKPLQWPRD